MQAVFVQAFVIPVDSSVVVLQAREISLLLGKKDDVVQNAADLVVVVVVVVVERDPFSREQWS